MVTHDENPSPQSATSRPSTLERQPGPEAAPVQTAPGPPEPGQPAHHGTQPAAPVLDQEEISDAELVSHLRKSGFESALGDRTLKALMDYENAVFQTWMTSGLIWEKIATLTHHQTGRAFRGYSNWTPEEARELRLETVTQALMAFKTSVLEEWHPDGGASVKTYFTTKCLWIFLNEYKKFARAKSTSPVLRDDITTLHHQPDPQDIVVARDTASTLLSRLKPEMQMILQYRAESFTNREIAELIGITEKAVEGRLRRYYDGKSWEGFGDE